MQAQPGSKHVNGLQDSHAGAELVSASHRAAVIEESTLSVQRTAVVALLATILLSGYMVAVG